MDFLCWLVEINSAEFRFVEESIIGGSNLRLFDAHSSVLSYHLHSLTHGLDTLGIHEVVVETVHSVIDGDIALPGEEKVPCVQSLVRVEY